MKTQKRFVRSIVLLVLLLLLPAQNTVTVAIVRDRWPLTQDEMAHTAIVTAPEKVRMASPTGIWTTKAPMQVPRERPAAVALGGLIYVMGGTNDSGPLNSVEVYDPQSDTWTYRSPMPGPKGWAGAAVANGRIYVIGPPDPEVYEYDPTGDTWAIKASVPMTLTTYAVALASIGGQIYAAFPPPTGDHYVVYMYDPFQDTWQPRQGGPVGRSIAALGVADGMIYAVGGGVANQQPSETNRIDRYDPSTDTWTVDALPRMPTARTHLGATIPIVGGRMYVIGGWDGFSAIPSVEVYDPWTNAWLSETPMPTERYHVACAAIENKIYAVGGNWGGWGGHWLTTNEELTLPQPQPRVNPIAFISDRDGYFEVYTSDEDGTHRLRVTNDSFAQWMPSWSPTEPRLAVADDRYGNFDIFTFGADGSDWHRITTDSRNEFKPAWSPDGQEIAFLREMSTDTLHLWVASAEGGNERQLTFGPGSEEERPAWSPDGLRIAFTSNRGGDWQIYVADADDGGNVITLTNMPGGAAAPDWSPDGQRIAFHSQGDIYAMDADGSNVQNLTQNGLGNMSPQWSPDGSKIVFLSVRDGHAQVYVMNSDGSGQHNISNNAANEWGPAWWRAASVVRRVYLPVVMKNCCYTGTGPVVLFGGYTDQGNVADLWRYNGSDWTQVVWSGQGPAPRNHHGMVFDDHRGKVVVFGGAGNQVILGDTWEFSPSSGLWTAVSTAHAPSPRYDFGMVYDKQRNVTVLFGGTPGSYIFYTDTWEYDGADWHQVSTPHSPPGFLDGAMVYDEVRGRVVLVTGWQAQGFGWVNETWEYDGTDWTYVAQAPSWRYNFDLAYDVARQRVVLFGGYEHGGIGCGLADTWEYDGQQWTLVTPPHSPPGRCGHSMTYDPSRQVVVLFGGDVGGGGNFSDDTWEYDGSDWRQILSPNQPPPRVWAVMVASSGTEESVWAISGR